MYFQWGDTQGYAAEQVGDGEGLKAFSWADYKFSIGGSSSNFSKYNASDSKTTLDPENDAAHVNMGGNWRMPTQEDFVELCQNTDLYLVPTEGEEVKGNIQENDEYPIYFKWESEPLNTRGMKFYKKGDKQTYLFIPISGSVDEGGIVFDEEGGYSFLHCSQLSSSDVRRSWLFCVTPAEGSMYDDYRYFGMPVRGVLAQ